MFLSGSFLHFTFHSILILGALAGLIDIGASWLSDIKEGVCRDAFWLNREQCCWSANDTTLDEERCSQVSSMFSIAPNIFNSFNPLLHDKIS